MQSSPLLICRTGLWIGLCFSRCVPKDLVVLPANVNLPSVYYVFWLLCSGWNAQVCTFSPWKSIITVPQLVGTIVSFVPSSLLSPELVGACGYLLTLAQAECKRGCSCCDGCQPLANLSIPSPPSLFIVPGLPLRNSLGHGHATLDILSNSTLECHPCVIYNNLL